MRGQEPAATHASPPYRPISAALAIAPSVSVVIPARNEAANLPHVFGTLPPWIDEIVLVDGHSVDDTVAVTRALCPQAKVVTQPGRGKGDALQAGFTAATGDILVMIDADGSTDGTEIIRFVGALVAGADFAKGSRFSSSGGSDDITGVRRYGNWLLSVLVNWMFGTHFTDLCYGYNAFWARHLDAIDVSSCSGFEVETLINIRAAKAGLTIHEVPSHESPRIFGASNLHAVRDGWRILRIIMREWLGGGWRRGSRRPAAGRPAPVSAVRPYRMPGPDREPSVYDRDIVAALREGDRAGAAGVFGRHAKGLYTYCRSQLTAPADAAGAVRDTLLVASAEASRLSQPDRLRAWLFALARNECRRRLRDAAPPGGLYEAAQAMDDTGTFSVTPEAEFRARARAALAGLDPTDREISELNLRHGFYGADLADIIGAPRGKAHALAARARSRFERSLGVLLLARSSREHCEELAAILDGQPALSRRRPALRGLTLRRRVKRHIRHCPVCGERRRSGLNPAILFSLLPGIRLPAGLRRQTLGLISDSSPAGAARRALVLDRAAPFGPDGFPVQQSTPPAPGWRLSFVPAVAAAAAALALLGGAMYHAGRPAGHDPAPAVTSRHPTPTRSSGSALTPARVAPPGARDARPGPVPSGSPRASPSASSASSSPSPAPAVPPATGAAPG